MSNGSSGIRFVTSGRREGWEGVRLQELCDRLRPVFPSVDHWRQWAEIDPRRRADIKRRLVRMCIATGRDLDDPFPRWPSQDKTEDDGVPIGHTQGGHLFTYPLRDFPSGITCLGGVGSGKTTAGHHIVTELHTRGVGALEIDLRGDSSVLACYLPDALLIPSESFKLNVFEPPHGVDTWRWIQQVAARFTFDFGLQEAGHATMLHLLEPYVTACLERNEIPTLPGFFDSLPR